MKVNINSSITIDASKEAIFSIVSDHEGTDNWVDEVKSVKLIKKGTPKNGLGAIRRVDFKPMFWTSVNEKIVLFKENQEYHYKVIKMPGVSDHLGIFSLEENGNNQTTVHWKVYLEFKKYHFMRLLSGKFGKDFKAVQESGLLKLKKQLES